MRDIKLKTCITVMGELITDSSGDDHTKTLTAMSDQFPNIMNALANHVGS